MKTEETNKLIAEFLGFKERVFTDSKGKTTKTYSLPNPKTSNGLPLLKIHKEKSLSRYSTDWNWLMQVVEKIESSGYNTKIESLEHTRVSIGNGKLTTLIQVDKETKIEAVYNACVEFIKWHNSANKN